ncbi:hypothetical protein AXF42_Ash000268 [Apostasia shenzhenica]|uniref:A-kinase anchor protein 7-like phosphoesterase domain-containing protein n=1 Tax=Apostasia shenzhenica TaxID=1088818 RepID=A0A2I0AFY8_9ASPA|nr:hypothetical protein AXF42_Ash000268 [Apostasia shenzhenica]
MKYNPQFKQYESLFNTNFPFNWHWDWVEQAWNMMKRHQRTSLSLESMSEDDVDCKSEPKPVEGYMITPIAVKTELVSEMRKTACLASSCFSFTMLLASLDFTQRDLKRGIRSLWRAHFISIAKMEFMDMVIEGTSNENVTEASEKVRNILEQATKSPNLDYSHFVSLPLAIHPELLEKLQKFQNSVLGEVDNVSDTDQDCETSDRDNDTKQIEGSHTADNIEARNSNEHARVCIDATGLGIDKSIFIKPGTFHLTVLMLKLWNKDRVAKATEVLKSQYLFKAGICSLIPLLKTSFLVNEKACMRGSPAKAQVLYAPVEEVGGEGPLITWNYRIGYSCVQLIPALSSDAFCSQVLLSIVLGWGLGCSRVQLPATANVIPTCSLLGFLALEFSSRLLPGLVYIASGSCYGLLLGLTPCCSWFQQASRSSAFLDLILRSLPQYPIVENSVGFLILPSLEKDRLIEQILVSMQHAIVSFFTGGGPTTETCAIGIVTKDITILSINSVRLRNKRNRRRDSFDARNIFETYGSEDWGSYLIKEVHLSQRFLFDESGYYHCCASIPFPESMDVA